MSKHYYAYRTFIADLPSYALLPVSSDAVYVDGMYYTEHKFLLLLSRAVKEKFQMVPKLNDEGVVAHSKETRKEKQERVRLDTNYEYYISNPKDIEWFAKEYIINAEEFLQFLQDQNKKQATENDNTEAVTEALPQEA